MSPRRRAFVYFLFCVGWFLFPVFWIESKPTGFRLKSGDALPPVFENGTFLIRSGERAVIDWEAFSIALQEEVRFQQAGAHSAVLNCVTGRERSELLGTLTSNGAVYLINPNGILIGEEARIETAGFIASTLGLSGDTLSDEERFFQGESAEGVINRGHIHCPAGDIFLIGKTIDNSGTVSAPEGRQGLLAGCEVWIRPFGAPEMHIRSEEPVDVEALKENPYALAIRHSGISVGKEVYCISEEGLSAVAGEITALDGNQGGKVQVLGCQVHLLDKTRINASGFQGGGEILIGGDYQGSNPKVGNANYVWVGPEAKIEANAIAEGPGGKIIFWGNQQNHYYGKASVRGGELGGNGGFVEVSGAYLNYNGEADRSAPLGKPGLLFLDPSDITISTGADSNVAFAAGTWTGTANTCVLNTTTLTGGGAGGLGAGSVTVSTVSGSTAVGTITVSNPISWSGTTTLTLLATRNILINANITNSNGGGIPFTAMDFTAQGTGTGTSVNGILVASGVTVSSQDGHIIMAGRSPGTAGNDNNGISIAGTVSVVSGGQGYIQLAGTGAASTGNTNHGISIATGGISSTSNLTGTSNPAIRLTGQGVGAGASNGNMGVRLFSGNVICSGNGDILITGTGGTGTGGNNFGTEVLSITTVGSGTIRFVNCYGGSSGVAGVGTNNLGAQLSANNCLVTGTAGAVIFENCTGGGGTGVTGSNHGVFWAGTHTAILGSLTLSNCLGGGATSGQTQSRGVWQINGTLRVTGTASTLGTGITMTNCTGGKALSGVSANACAGIDITGTVSVLGPVAGISLGGIGGGNAVGDTSNTQVGVLINSTSSVVNQSGTGGITIAGTGGFGSGGSNHGVRISGTINGASGSVNGSISITGTARQADASSNGVLYLSGTVSTSTSTGGNISVAGAVTGTASPVAFTGTTVGTTTLQNAAGTILVTGTTSFGLTGSGSVNISSTAGNIQFMNRINLASASASIGFFGAGAGNVTFEDVIDGARSLTLGNLGTGGNIQLRGNVGPTNRLTALSLSGSNSTLQLGNASGITVQLANAAFSAPMAVSLLGGASTINTGVTGGAITFSKTIDGGQDLTLQAGTGAVTFSGNVGNTTPLGALSVSTGSGLTIDTGVTTLNASQFTTSIATVLRNTGTCTITTSNTNGINFVSTINGTAAGSQALVLAAPTGTVTLGNIVGGSVRLGAFSITAGDLLLMSNDVTANSFSVGSSVPTRFTKSGTTTVDTSTFSGPISFGGTINGNTVNVQSVTLNAGSSTVSLLGNVGTTTALGALNITGTGGLSFGASVANVAALSFATSTSTPTTLNGSSLTITTTGASGITFGSIAGAVAAGQGLTLSPGANPITLSGTVGTSLIPLGPISITNVSDLAAASPIVAASITQSAGTGTTTFSGSVTTTATAPGGVISLTGKNFTFNNPVTATGDVTVEMNAGTLNIASAAIMNIQGEFLENGINSAVNLAGAINTTNAGISFNSPITLTGSTTLTTAGLSGYIYTLRTVNGLTSGGQPFTLAAVGNIVLGDVIGGSTRLGALNVTGAIDVTLHGNVTANSFSVASAIPTSLAKIGTTTIDTSAFGGAISFGGAIRGATSNAQLLTLTAGSGAVSLLGNVGLVGTPLGTLSITTTGGLSFGASAANVYAEAFTTAASTTLNASSLTITTTSGSGITFGSIAGVVAGAQGLILSPGANPIALNGTVGTSVIPLGPITITNVSNLTAASAIVAASITQSAGTGTTTFSGSVTTTATAPGGVISLTGKDFTFSNPVTATGDVTVAMDAGALTIPAAAVMNIQGAFTETETGASTVDLAGAINTTHGDISFASPITLTGTTALTSAGSPANIDLAGTINGGFALAIEADEAVTLESDIGAGIPLGALSITAPGGLSFGASVADVFAQSFATSSLTPTTINSASLTVTTTGVSGIAFGSIAGVVAGAQGLTLSPGDNPIVLNGTVGTSLIPLGPILITSVSNLAASSGIVAASITQSAGTGTTIFSGSITTTATAPGGVISLTGKNFTLNGGAATGDVTVAMDAGLFTNGSGTVLNIEGAFTQTETGASTVNLAGAINTTDGSISFASPITLTSSATLAAGGSPANINIASTINGLTAGGQPLTLTAAEAITLSGTVGASTRLGAFTITNGSSLALTNNVTANSFSITSSTPTTLSKSGTTTIDTSAASGAIAFGGAILGTTSNSQLLTLNAGSGGVSLLGNVGLVGTPIGTLNITATGGLSFGASVTNVYAQAFATLSTTPTTLNAASLTVTTTDGSGITFGSIAGVVAGAQGLTLSPGANPIALNGTVGTSFIPLGPITISNVSNLTASSAIIAASITQSAGTGTTTFSSTVETTATVPGGVIALTGRNFTFNSDVTARGDVTLTMTTGLLTIANSAVMNITGDLTQTGTSACNLAGEINTTNGEISFASPITLTDDIIVTAGGAPANITFNSTIDGNAKLEVEAGEALTFGDVVGGVDPLESLQVVAGTEITLDGDQTVALGPMTYTGKVVLTQPATQLTDGGSAPMQFLLNTMFNGGESIEGNSDLTLRALNTTVTVEGDINLSGIDGDPSNINGKELSITGGLGITCDGMVITQGADDLAGVGGNGGTVTMSSSGGSILIHNINTSGGTGASNSDGDAGDITLHPSSGLSMGFPTGLIIISGDLSGSGEGNLVAIPGGTLPGSAVGGTITLSSNRSAPTTVATIVSTLGGNDVTIRGESILVGPNEAMTVFGDILFAANMIELSDTVALRSLAILTVTTNLNTHGPYEILNNTGSLYETPSLHFYGGSGYVNTGTLVPAGGELDAQDLGYSASTFRPLLLYNGHILNFDTTNQPIPPPPNVYPAGLGPFLFYQLIVADAQLSDLLPVFGVDLAPPYKLCPQPKKGAPVKCNSYNLFPFKSR